MQEELLAPRVISNINRHNKRADVDMTKRGHSNATRSHITRAIEASQPKPGRGH
jgi:hypothetical protein